MEMSTQSKVVFIKSVLIITRRREMITRRGDNGPKQETHVYVMSSKHSEILTQREFY